MGLGSILEALGPKPCTLARRSSLGLRVQGAQRSTLRYQGLYNHPAPEDSVLASRKAQK